METPRVLPLRIAVGHHTAQLEPALLVRAVSEELAAQLAPLLNKRQKEQLEKALATTIARSRQPTRISAALNAIVPAVGLNLGVQLATDLTTLARQGGWQGGQHAGLLTLRDMAAAHDARLVVIFDDTDTWSEGDEDMALRARDFFMALRTLVDCPEVTIFVAVQDHWSRPGAQTGSRTDAARLQYRELEQRAARCLHVPLPQTPEQARTLITAILERRIEITLDEDSPDDGWCTDLFTNEALDTLATRCLQHSVRQALADVRDAFDHNDVLPDRIDRQHLVDAMG
jgi:hypothetical protein